MITGIIQGYSQTGFRGGLNLSTNNDQGEGPILGWHIVGYVELETFKPISYRMEFKCTRIGYQKNKSTLVSIYNASLPVLLEYKSIYHNKTRFYIGLEPGLFIGGNTIPKERIRSLQYIFKLNHKESHDTQQIYRQDFNIEGVLGFKIDCKPDIYVFANAGFITNDFYISVSIGI